MIEKTVRPSGELGPGLQLVAAGDALDQQAGTFGFELRLEAFDGRFNFFAGRFLEREGFRRGREPGRSMQGVRDGFRSQGPIRREEQRFDNTGQVHPTIFWKTAPKGKKRSA